jgi:23S rRNA pseudouridine1911/1915/1917 synthase
MEPKVIYQDDDLLVLDKPSGWVVNDADTTKNLQTLQTWLKDNFDFPISNSLEMRSGIVHRLDKDTSGVLLVAKTSEMFSYLQSQFKERKVEKKYVALVHGEVEPARGEIDAPTGRLPWNRKRFGVLPGGREAKTQYKVVRSYDKEGEKYTLLELHPKTGRTHQIRVHLKYIKHPIVADKAYVGRKNWRHDIKWCPRLFLHAKKIAFQYPKGIKASFEVELPEDLRNVLKTLS